MSKKDMKNKENLQSNKKNAVLEEIISWIKAAVVALILYSFTSIFIFVATVDGHSMDSTFRHGDRILVRRLAYKDKLPDYEDIVIFTNEYRGYELIKRVIGLPGDHIKIEDGLVYRNGVKLEEPYLDEGIITEEYDGEIDEIIRDGHIFVLGDNRPDSGDSRWSVVGQVDMHKVKGKVIFRMFPNTSTF